MTKYGMKKRMAVTGSAFLTYRFRHRRDEASAEPFDLISRIRKSPDSSSEPSRLLSLVPYTIFAFFAISSGIVSPRISASCLLMTMV